MSFQTFGWIFDDGIFETNQWIFNIFLYLGLNNLSRNQVVIMTRKRVDFILDKSKIKIIIKAGILR